MNKPQQGLRMRNPLPAPPAPVRHRAAPLEVVQATDPVPRADEARRIDREARFVERRAIVVGTDQTSEVLRFKPGIVYNRLRVSFLGDFQTNLGLVVGFGGAPEAKVPADATGRERLLCAGYALVTPWTGTAQRFGGNTRQYDLGAAIAEEIWAAALVLDNANPAAARNVVVVVDAWYVPLGAE